MQEYVTYSFPIVINIPYLLHEDQAINRVRAKRPLAAIVQASSPRGHSAKAATPRLAVGAVKRLACGIVQEIEDALVLIHARADQHPVQLVELLGV